MSLTNQSKWWCLQWRRLFVFLNLAKWNPQLLCNDIFDHDLEKGRQLENLSNDGMKNLKLRAVSVKLKILDEAETYHSRYGWT
ncbi:hypothetical protein TNCV_3688031 [Trichonephila clavipes]|uniref:Uncharacterized protein n=1 Tax=Trichonephila clavipes TaxID=2585209 RepID=A0A8X6REZ9_TRICX|nr:hypothetical protein TNCV_3688031 [Trichonephila clavipes]